MNWDYWIDQLRHNGVYAVLVFFAALWAKAKRDMDKAADDESRLYHRKQHARLGAATLFFGAVVVVTWTYETFVFEPGQVGVTMIEGRFSNLKHYSPSASSTRSSGVNHTISATDRTGRFYSITEKGFTEDYDHHWILVNDVRRSDFTLTFEQSYYERKSERMTDGGTEKAAANDNRRIRKQFRLAFTEDDVTSGDTYSVVYVPSPDDPLRALGTLKLVPREGETVEIPWIDGLARTSQPELRNLVWALGSVAHAAEEASEKLFDGEADDYIVERLGELLSSENLAEQLVARDALLESPEDGRRFVNEMALHPPDTAEDALTFWLNVSGLAFGLEGTAHPVDDATKEVIAEKLLAVGAYEQAALQFKQLGDDNDEEASRFMSLDLNRLPRATAGEWIAVPRPPFKHLRVAYYMSPLVFYGDGCFRATFKGGEYSAEEARPRYAISLWRDDTREGYEFYLGMDADGSRTTEFTIYKRRSRGGLNPVTKLNKKWEKHEAIRAFDRGENTLAICRSGTKLLFYANDQLLFETSEPEQERHRFIGIDVSVGTEVHVRDFGLCLRRNCGY